jgi:hypothetical protein
MNTALLITMGFCAVGTAVTEKVCIAFGKTDMAEYVRVSGTSMVGATAIGLAVSLLNTLRKAVS